MSARPVIRAYREADEAGVVALWRVVFPEAPAHNRPADDIRHKLAVQRDLFLVAEAGGAIVGSAMAGFDGHRGWVHYVAVHPDARRAGVGSQLMREVERRLRAVGCPKWNLQVRADNGAVVDFYRSLGFEVEDRISMGKRLA